MVLGERDVGEGREGELDWLSSYKSYMKNI